MSSEEVVIDVRDLSKRYEIYATPRDRLKQLVLPRLHQATNRMGVALGTTKYRLAPTYFREFWALRNVSFEVRRGETLGIIGRNGGGKSTLLQIIAGTMAPTSGTVEVKGRVAALLELGSGFNPEFSGKENVFLNGRILGLNQREIEERYDRIVEFAEIGEFIDEPVKTYSSGMFLRLAFAVQAHIDASIVIIDEALAVGDVFFRQKCYERLAELRQAGAVILLVSHAMTEIEQFCDRAILLDHGSLAFSGPAMEATKRYYLQHQSSDTAPAIHGANHTQSGTVCDLSHDAISIWPADGAFQDAKAVIQVDNGWGKCTYYTVRDTRGGPCNHFAQGDTAVFYYEFQLSRPIAVPLGGVVLQSARGINVHGKGSLEYGHAAPDYLPAGSLIRCRQDVELNLELGEYTFELGLATIDAASYANMSSLSHEQLFSRIVRICHLPKAGVISIGWREQHAGAPLTHHGVADLPGNFTFEFKVAKSE
jgi:homopolymeric O-antigen transport system ATP-binding protein